MTVLVLLRHGQSQWNLEKRFTGHADVDLTAKGEQEAKEAGKSLKGVRLDCVFTSTLLRARRTASLLLAAAGQSSEVVEHDALRERNYGDLTGLSKDDVSRKYGEEQVRRWRLSFDEAPPHGESLKEVLVRVSIYYKELIEPRLQRGENVMICAHEHPLRAMLLVLGEHTPDTITEVELPTGVPVVFEFQNGNALKQKLQAEHHHVP